MCEFLPPDILRWSHHCFTEQQQQRIPFPIQESEFFNLRLTIDSRNIETVDEFVYLNYTIRAGKENQNAETTRSHDDRF